MTRSPQPSASPAPDKTDGARSAAKRRIDQLLVERGYVETRARAQAAIAAGLVTANGLAVTKPSDRIVSDAVLEAAEPHPFVSRGGVKLEAALDAFGLDPAGRACLDIGASTGGFTDVLLRRGAARVVCVDVGRDQLHPRIATDPRVTVLEGTDARGLDPDAVQGRAGFVVVDVSFISLRLVLPAVRRLMVPGGILVALVKPQFEVGREGIGRGGIVRDDALRDAALGGIESLAGALGLTVLGRMRSPITGGDGNVEFLLAARDGTGPAAHAEAGEGAQDG